MMRAATAEDAVAIDSFLARHPEATMYPRDNLRDFGVCGGTADRATRFWLRENGTGGLEAVLGLSKAGFVFVAPGRACEREEAAELLAGKAVSGIIGSSDLVAQMRLCLGLDRAQVRRDIDEPQYALDLTELSVPEATSELRAATDGDRETLEAWRRDYLGEVFALPAAEAAEQASRQIGSMIERGRLAVLHSDEKLLAMTAFNAVLPDIVQVGNVYTPQKLRGRRYARRAVALHLDTARQRGVKRAVLSASGGSAARAYEGIGFSRIGWFTMLIFDGQQMVSAA